MNRNHSWISIDAAEKHYNTPIAIFLSLLIPVSTHSWSHLLCGPAGACGSLYTLASSCKLLDLASLTTICRHCRRFRQGVSHLFPNICLRDDNDLFRFLNPAIMQTLESPALANDIVGRVDVTTSTYFFVTSMILCEQTLSSAFVGSQLNTGTSCTILYERILITLSRQNICRTYYFLISYFRGWYYWRYTDMAFGSGFPKRPMWRPYSDLQSTRPSKLWSLNLLWPSYRPLQTSIIRQLISSYRYRSIWSFASTTICR